MLGCCSGGQHLCLYQGFVDRCCIPDVTHPMMSIGWEVESAVCIPASAAIARLAWSHGLNRVTGLSPMVGNIGLHFIV